MTFFSGKPKLIRRPNPNVVKDGAKYTVIKPVKKPVERPITNKTQE